MGLFDEDLTRRIQDYKAALNRLGGEGRRDFVDAARRNEDWPRPTDQYLAGHARTWGRGLRAAEYAQLAYDTKNRAGVLVFAYIHPVHRNQGLAFVDHESEYIVTFDCDQDLNYDLFSPTNGTRPWVRERTTRGTHWRLKDTER